MTSTGEKWYSYYDHQSVIKRGKKEGSVTDEYFAYWSLSIDHGNHKLLSD